MYKTFLIAATMLTVNGATMAQSPTTAPPVQSKPAVSIDKTLYQPKSSYFANRFGLGFAGGDPKPLFSYDLLKTKTGVFGLHNTSVGLGLFVSQNDLHWNRVDFGPQLNLTYRHVFVGVAYRPISERAVVTFGIKF